jgi:hypothetical protein
VSTFHDTVAIVRRSDFLGSQVAKDVMESQDTLADACERIVPSRLKKFSKYFFKRLGTYTEVQPTAVMMDIIVTFRLGLGTYSSVM